ncbi:hypothetical protein D9758_000665 [Tetrapyrgos nigripes]|uniref:Mitochondrial outer membrane transport complex Sam37/metaxin N-terminal domain-containing protein n=1 Tax=Tetrapyrgos nigripes TaxID=182062 RepID=A0A8H5LXG7_9AGAR|nr:hypothetical protein D9758_000665 [Tetrapyrgos nigripes]
MMASSTPLELFVWPGAWGLPSIDPLCLSAIIYLQLALPGQFTVIESVNPDVSPTGQFPFLKHGGRTFASFSAILEYISTLQNLDASLDTLQKSQQTAWLASAESDIGNLVSHMLFAIDANWNKLTHPAIVYDFPFPARYYSPQRIRESWKPRLESSGFWALPDIEQEDTDSKHSDDRKQKSKELKAQDRLWGVKPKDRFLRVFEREKITERAKSILDIFTRLLGDSTFFQSEQPSTLDVVVAGHILLLLIPPYPDPLLQDLLKKAYPSLVSHAERIHGQVKDASLPTSRITKRESVWSLLPNISDTDDAWLIRLRWAYLGLTIGGFAAYATSTFIRRR